MSTTSDSVSEPAIPAEISFSALASALGSPVRWRILREISRGEGLLIVEVAERLGMKQGTISKHMKVLRDKGLVATNRAGLNSIPAGRLISAEEGIVDYGNCLLRLRRDG
jgi:DNA-binding transcriptional ArsR family regulator